MSNDNQQHEKPGTAEQVKMGEEQKQEPLQAASSVDRQSGEEQPQAMGERAEERGPEGRPIQREKPAKHPGLRGTAAMDPKTRQEVARKGGQAVSKNRAHMAEIGRKGGQTVSKNREHMAKIGRKGGAASRGHRSSSS